MARKPRAATTREVLIEVAEEEGLFSKSNHRTRPYSPVNTTSSIAGILDALKRRRIAVTLGTVFEASGNDSGFVAMIALDYATHTGVGRNPHVALSRAVRSMNKGEKKRIDLIIAAEKDERKRQKSAKRPTKKAKVKATKPKKQSETPGIYKPPSSETFLI